MTTLYRESGRPMFDAADKQFLLALSSHLADGARRLLVSEATDRDATHYDAPGWSSCLISGTSRLRHRVSKMVGELPDGDPDLGRLPSAVIAVAARARRNSERPDQPSGITIARVQSRTGRWLVLHGACLLDDGAPRVAVIIEPAHPDRIYPLLAAAYQFTERECDITDLVLHGASTRQIADRLVLSPHTVQQHLKNIFDKTAAHYEPRLRDNEHRVQAGAPMLGGSLTRPAR